MRRIKTAVLAYSGGLDTSVILKWLQETHNCKVIAFLADLGQGEDMKKAKARALSLGADKVVIEDLRETFARDYVFPMFRANTLYEGAYLLGTAIARPLIAKRQIEIAEETGAEIVCHGATGKGNDQMRFEIAYAALNPALQVIAPWREWEMQGRRDLLNYAKAHKIKLEGALPQEPPFSVDANLLHRSSEGRVLEDPNLAPPEKVWEWTRNPKDAPNTAENITIGFEKGDATSFNGKRLSPAALLGKLNALGAKHGIGRADIVENRATGMKARGVYETPGGTILLAAHRGVEQVALDRQAAHLKDEIMPRYAALIYNGLWFSPERQMLQALIDESQKGVSGTARLKLYKGSAMLTGRDGGARSLYSTAHASFEKDSVYDQRDAEGFIKLTSLRLSLARRKAKR